ncbi:ADP-ribosylation factor-like protein 4D [Sardina pilchardus]|uniref:ADP-ribosylation factor-like protein 4D n=1 Tax=Sardina pilchardus TaxID=27697 RepID=UPI002E124E7B
MGNQLTEMSPNTPLLPNLKPVHIVVLGLDAAGKTSLLYRLKLREFVETIPTKGFNMERIKVSVAAGSSRTATFQVWDVGGHEKLRPLWKSYTRRTDGVVFVVDSNETERLEEAKAELQKVCRVPENQGVPVLVLANKQDLPLAMNEQEVEKALGLHELSNSTPHHTQGCSALDGQGLQTGLERLYEMILKRKKSNRSSRKGR